jgi:DUF4097 and DUF4098 domain-containing protein YvlB
MVDDTDYDDDKYVKDEQTLQADLNGIDTVKLHNVNGSIKATIGSANSLDMIVREKVRITDKIDAQELLAEAKVVSRREGSTLVVEIDYGKFKEHKHKGYYQSSYEVTLPARLSVYFKTTNGSISAPAFDGMVKLHTTNGSIASEGAGDKAVLGTTNGSILIKMVRGEVEAETTNGNIEISSISGPVNAETTNGNVEVKLEGALAGDCNLGTTNGSIYFMAGAGSSYKVKADTTHGKVHGKEDFEYNKKKTYMSGIVGDGRYSVSLETTNGSIHIK